MSLAITENDVQRMRRILLDLLVRSESDECLVCDSGGYVLAQEGPDRHDPFLISALGAGVFAASRELAKLLGEDEFSAVFHQGEKKSIFIRAVNKDILLVNVFARTGNIGLVKLYAAPAAAELKALFDEIATSRQRQMPTPADGRGFVINDAGNVFKLKE